MGGFGDNAIITEIYKAVMMTTQFYFFSRLQSILSQIRRKDEIRLRAVLCHRTVWQWHVSPYSVAVTCVTVQCGSDVPRYSVAVTCVTVHCGSDMCHGTVWQWHVSRYSVAVTCVTVQCGSDTCHGTVWQWHVSRYSVTVTCVTVQCGSDMCHGTVWQWRLYGRWRLQVPRTARWGARISPYKSSPTWNCILQTAKVLRDVGFWQWWRDVGFWQWCCWWFSCDYLVFTSRTDCESSKLHVSILQRIIQKETSYATFHGGVWQHGIRNALRQTSGVWRLSIGSDLIHGPCGARVAT